MSLRSFSIVWEGSEATGSALLVLLALGEHWDSRVGYAYPGIERLARYARCSVRTVQTKLGELEELGELSVARGGGAKNTNRYYLNFKKLKATAAARNAEEECSGNPAGFAPFEGEEKPRKLRQNPAESGTDFDKKPRKLRQKTPQNRAPDLRGKVKEDSRKFKEGEEGRAESSESPPPSDFDFSLSALAELFPKALIPVPKVEMSLVEMLGSSLEDLEPEDYEALVCWFVHADDQARGRTVWPRSRREFLENFAETVEKVRTWWADKGADWWAGKVDLERRRAARLAAEEDGEDREELSAAEAVAFLREKGGAA